MWTLLADSGNVVNPGYKASCVELMMFLSGRSTWIGVLVSLIFLNFILSMK